MRVFGCGRIPRQQFTALHIRTAQQAARRCPSFLSLLPSACGRVPLSVLSAATTMTSEAKPGDVLSTLSLGTVLNEVAGSSLHHLRTSLQLHGVCLGLVKTWNSCCLGISIHQVVCLGSRHGEAGTRMKPRNALCCATSV